MKKNKFAAIIFSAVCLIVIITTAANDIKAQQSSVSFNTKGISVIFNIQTSSPDVSKQSFGSVYFTGYDDDEKESRVHRVLADRESGVYFGYDLIIETGAAPNKFKVSIKPLSINPPKDMRLNELTAGALPKYPDDLTVEDGDTIALEVLSNPQTKVKITDLIKITTKKPQSSDSSLFNTSMSTGGGIGVSNSNGSSGIGTGGGKGAGSGNGTGASTGNGVNSSSGLFSKQKYEDFTLNDVKLRLTSPQLLVDGAISSLRGSEWNGIIEGSMLYLYIPQVGRLVFSLFPRSGFSFQRGALIESNKISFRLDNRRYELFSNGPIVGSGGVWNLWLLNDPNYKPDSTFNASSAEVVQYGAANDADYLLTKKSQQMRRLNPISPVQGNVKSPYKDWLEQNVRYIITDEEKQSFLQLKTDAEREQFIESFWQRRDPNPETKENEFRQEYYSRIAYANQNFAFAKTPGWQTDRGRVYITYGKPDEIQKGVLDEVWLYKSLPELGNDVRFEFADTEKNGSFSLRQ